MKEKQEFDEATLLFSALV